MKHSTPWYNTSSTELKYKLIFSRSMKSQRFIVFVTLAFTLINLALLFFSQPFEHRLTLVVSSISIAVCTVLTWCKLVHKPGLLGVYMANDAGQLVQRAGVVFDIDTNSKVLPFACLLVLTQQLPAERENSLVKTQPQLVAQRYLIFDDALDRNAYRHLCRLILQASKSC
ncbi:hypothetical protein QWY77_04925 [Thalassotalea ponticola]|uniref:protein YgfX n=1 Tax=Thalassotalea ponticola TaxID=1523392 RepID=UPI0025B29FF8|nr:protein YgfX [Thalassotalea ponticola]MDN3652110.1 hypothetical protein [Thalassotalea ponticola]